MTGPRHVSVCMATYNGSAYVEEQLRSILGQLGEHDEVIVVDDLSTDDTVSVVRALGDPRIQVHVKLTNTGYADTFQLALQRASGAHIFLADQDDVWPSGRVDAMRGALRDAKVVVGAVDILGTDAPLRGPFGQRSWRLPSDPTHRLRILGALAMSNVPYFGSAMALRADLLPCVLPYPSSARELPDAWIAMNGLLHRSIAHLDDVVVLRRVHGHNATGRVRSLPRVAWGRVLFLRMLWDAWRRRASLSR